MAKPGNLFKSFFNAPLSFMTKSTIVPDNVIDELEIDPSQPIIYVIKINAGSDRFALSQACKALGMPSPGKPVQLGSMTVPGLIALENPSPAFFGQAKATNAAQVGEQILKAHQLDETIDAQLLPVNIIWGRNPGKEDADFASIITDTDSPSWLRKFFMVLFSGRNNLIRFSQPVSLRYMTDRHGADKDAGRKMLRVARFHFYRQTLSATGPKLWSREQMINSVLSSVMVKKAMDEAISEGKSRQDVKLEARKLLLEIAADYKDSWVRLGNRFLTWLWNKLYNGIIVNNAETVRNLAEQGHEIIYVPCHRSHMDYLLLSYVIYNQGLVPPHIAAGINLNFGPIGPILRRGGAFYLRRSFKGNKLYSAVFREYLAQLFNKGYSVEYFTEGGRSRTGRLLPPKTGMLAMTIQALLKGIERPITFVPVYLGYEHVMEVNTYLKELRGSAKKSESMFGIFKAIRNLRDYGNGFVNFGEPVSLNKYLSNSVPDWRDSIDPNETAKPQWLTPVCNDLAHDLMIAINNTTALNATTLTAISLLAADHYALTQEELEAQLDLYLELQRKSRYTDQVTIPEQNGSEMIQHVITLKKVEVENDDFGAVIRLNDKESVLMSYYRNNIIHLFALPSLIAAQVLMHKQVSKAEILSAVHQLFPLFRDEWFLDALDVDAYALSIIDTLADAGLMMLDGDRLICAEYDSAEYFQLHLLSNIIRRTLQRYAVVLHLIRSGRATNKTDLEHASQTIAKRLSSMHGIKAPEFLDKKVLASLLSSLKHHGYIAGDEKGKLQPTEQLEPLTRTVTGSLQNEVMLSITQALR